MLKKSFLVLFILSAFGCASYLKRQSCEATNWFSYGEKVALEGRRLTGDPFVTECRAAEADIAESDLDNGFKSGLDQYCQPAIVLQNGKNGNYFNEEMCVGEGLNNLRAQHRAGILQYCDKSNGYTAGAKGKPYNKICPADLEKTFIPEFNRGRKAYLQTVINQSRNEISDLNNQIGRLQSEQSYKKGILFGLQARSNQALENKELSAQITSLNNEVTNIDNKIRTATSRQQSLKNKIKDLELEIVQLGN